MQKKINDFNNVKNNFKLKDIIIVLSIIILSVFAAKVVFAEDLEPEIDNINLIFEKESYSLMEDTSTRVSFTIENNNPVQAKLLVWADCEDEDEELVCNYSKQYTLVSNSTMTGSFYVQALEESDSKLSIYVKLLNSEEQEIEEFTTDIEITEDEEDGDFSVDLYDSSICIGKTTNVSLNIENDYRDGLYNIYLSNSKIAISSEYSNPIYLKDEKTIDYSVVVPENVIEGETFDLSLRIENEEIEVVKKMSVYARDCPEPNNDFTVSGPSTTTYTLSKGQSKTISYTLKNISNTNRTFYISEGNNNYGIHTDNSSNQITLNPNQSKLINFTFYVLEDCPSGTYDINLNFFDGLKSITKKIKIKVNPKSSINIESLSESNLNLTIGKNLQIMFVVENTGDIDEELTIELNPNNDLKATIADYKIDLDKHLSKYLTVYVSAGEFTQTGLSSLDIRVKGKTSKIEKELSYTIKVVTFSEPIDIELLSYPKVLYIEPNSSREFDITIRNKGQKIVINKIELTNIPQFVELITEQEITLNPGQTKTVSVKINIGDIPKEDISAQIRFVSNTGNVLEKPITLKLTEGTAEKETLKSKILGYLSLRNSILFGVIFICLLVILLFIVGVFKIRQT